MFHLIKPALPGPDLAQFLRKRAAGDIRVKIIRSTARKNSLQCPVGQKSLVGLYSPQDKVKSCRDFRKGGNLHAPCVLNFKEKRAEKQ